MNQIESVVQVIATRPNNRATQLVQALSKLSTASVSIEAMHCPLIQIEDYRDLDFFEPSLDQSEGSNEVELKPAKAFQYNGIIFISGNAVDKARDVLTTTEWSQLLSNQLYAIGEQTASVLQADLEQHSEQSRSRGVIFPQQMNSEGLLALSELQNLTSQTWLIVKGVGGREKLKQGLINAGATVDELAVYKRKLPDLEVQQRLAELSQQDPYWLVTSLEAMSNLSLILKQRSQSCRIIVSSDRIAEQANKLGFEIVAQAKDATDRELVGCVQSLIINMPRNR
jgi:uroporphyrinogen-III synthase